jgi:hypothetical protein
MSRPSPVLLAAGCGGLGLLLAGAIVLGLAIGVGMERKAAPAGPVEVGPSATKPEIKPSLTGGLLGGKPQPDVALDSSQCGELQSGGPVPDGCITGVIHCDETVIGHTAGGTKRFDTRFYEAHHCTPGTTNHDGGDERIYRLEMPDGDHHADIWLDTPCADLDLGAMKWSGKECPPPGALIDQCDMWPKDGTEREYVQLVSQRKTTWLIVVEGKGAEEGAFALTVQCFPGLH